MRHYHVQGAKSPEVFTSIAWALARCSVLVANGEPIGSVRPVECHDAKHLQRDVPSSSVLRLP